MSKESLVIFNPKKTLIPDPTYLSSLSVRDKFNLQRRELALRQRPRTAEGAINNIRAGKNVKWELLAPEDIANILHRAGEELEMPASMFRHIELKAPLNMLGGRTLMGLYKFVTFHPERKEQDAIPFLLEQAGIKANGEDVIKAMRRGRQVNWGQILPDAIGDVLAKAALELNKPLQMISAEDFDRPLQVLGGHSLSGLHNRFYTDPQRQGKETVAFLLERLNIPVGTPAKLRELGSTVFFEQATWQEIKEILVKTAQEMGKPVSMITAIDLRDYRAQFLGGRTLRELARRMEKDDVTISTLSSKIGSEVTLEDIIITSKSDNLFTWTRVSAIVLRQILDRAASERGKPSYLLTVDDLKGHFEFLNNRTLGGLHNYISKQERPENKPTMHFLFELTGIPVARDARSIIRLRYMKYAFQERYVEEKSIDMQRLLPWVQSFAKLYANSFLDISVEAVESEAVIYLMDKFQPGDNPIELIESLHAHLEQFLLEQSRLRYREKLLSTPIGKDRTLENVIASKENSLSQNEVIGEDLQAALATLTPLGKEIVWKVVVDELSLSEISDDLNIDIDSLEELYHDALTILRGNLLGTDSNRAAGV